VTQRNALTPVVKLSTPKGLAMQVQIINGLVDLTSPGVEVCSLLVEDMPDMEGIALLLKRQKSVRADKRWIIDYDMAAGTYLYNAMFESESAAEIVTAIKTLLETPVAEDGVR